MTTEERKPRRIQRTIKANERWTIREIGEVTISWQDVEGNAGEKRVTAEVIDKPASNL
jgi:hypothetical protein